jgi:hypothetical protein
MALAITLKYLSLVYPHDRSKGYITLKLNNFAKFERASKIVLRTFFLAILGLVNRHWIDNSTLPPIHHTPYDA